MSSPKQGMNLLRTLRNFVIANVFAVFPLLWAVLGWMPDQIKVRMRGWEEAPGPIKANGTALAGENYGEWRGGRVFRFYLHSGMAWQTLVFCFPGASGMETVESIELQKWKLLSLGKKGSRLTERASGTAEYVFAAPRFDLVGVAGGTVVWALIVLELLLAVLSWWCARQHREESWKKLFPPAIVVALALTSLTQLALPIQSFWANQASYPFPFGELAVAVVGRFAWMALLGIVSVTLLARCFGRRVFGVVLAMAACIYLEAGILSNGLAHLNGDVFLLQDRTRALWDAVAWASVFAIVLLAHPLLRKHYFFASLCLMVLVGASMFDTKHEKLADKSNLIVHDFVPNETVIHSLIYSTNRNVMVFILDSLEREQAHAIMEDPDAGPALREQFRGFTEYTNNIGALPQTLLAVPNLLTGRYPDGTESMSDFAWSCYGSESALRDFLETGQDVFMTTESLDCGYSTQTNEIQDVSGFKTSVLDASGNGGDVWSIRNFTRWRWMPFGAKAIVSDLTGRVAKNATGGMGEWRVFPVLSKAEIDSSSSGTFLWLHTPGVHVPVRWNRHGELLPAENSTDQGCVEQGIFIMEMLGRLFDQYRSMGIYDNSLILVLGDHGAHAEKTFQEDKKAGLLPGNARPCLWVKAPGVEHDFKESGAPTGHAQVAQLLKAAARKNLAEKDVEIILQSDKRVYRWMAVLGGNWTDWVVGRDGSFIVEEHKASFSSRTDVRPLRCGQRYSLAWQQVKDFAVGVSFQNVGSGTEYPYLASETHDATLEFCVSDTGKRYVLQLELYVAQGGTLRARCDIPGAEWKEFPVKPHGTITVSGIQADSSGVARVLIERVTGPHVAVSFTGLRLTEER